MATSTSFRDLLHAVNLRHGTDGFTSPPKEGHSNVGEDSSFLGHDAVLLSE